MLIMCMKKRFVLLVCILAILLGCSSVVLDTHFLSDSLHFAVSYPSTWDLSTPEQGLLVFSVPDAPLGTSVQIVALPTLDDVSLDIFVDKQRQALSVLLENFHFIANEPSRLGTADARVISFTSAEQGITFHWMRWYAVHNDVAYIVTYAAPALSFSSYLHTVTEMTGSFRYL
ncbi:DUF1795 domain-containing protein [Candidatus Woesearchaeota archaeon]|nr:DUF1795 domain-containing protein [Candidatus Woesearchaeota archaeon]